MPFVFVIDGAGNQIRETWTGTVTAAELRESCRQEWADPAYRRGMDMLSDFSQATLDITHDELRRFAQFIGQQEAVRRHAIVVGRLVGTQREQIAVLKAYGYGRLELSLHYGQLALLMVGAGLLPGLALGAWLGRGLADLYMDFFRFPYLEWSLQPFVIALACGFAVACNRSPKARLPTWSWFWMKATNAVGGSAALGSPRGSPR